MLKTARRLAANRSKDESGFTLIELMVVVLIIAVLMAIAIPTFLRGAEQGQGPQRPVVGGPRIVRVVVKVHPVQERDRFFMAMLKPLGIEKGQRFEPDARQRAILEEAATLGGAMGRTMLFDGHQRISGAIRCSPRPRSRVIDEKWRLIRVIRPLKTFTRLSTGTTSDAPP